MEAVRQLIKGIFHADLKNVTVKTPTQNDIEISFFKDGVEISVTFEPVFKLKKGWWLTEDVSVKTPFYDIKTTATYPNVKHSMQVHDFDELVSGMLILVERKKVFEEVKKADKFIGLTKKFFSDGRN